MPQDPRLLTYDLRIRYDDSSKVDKITSDIVGFFESHPGVDLKLPYKASLKDIATYSVDISIQVGLVFPTHMGSLLGVDGVPKGCM